MKLALRDKKEVLELELVLTDMTSPDRIYQLLVQGITKTITRICKF